MLTIFALPKAFQGHIGIIQTNAIRSWLLLRPRCEIILLGNEPGTAEIASRLGVRHIPEVECSEYGTPLVSSVFSIGQKCAQNRIVCYVNSDIILMSDFARAVPRLDKKAFLMIGQRWDVEINEPINFDDAEWEAKLRARVAEHGQLHSKSGIDYFVFSRGLYDSTPPFAIGRTAWDNWLVYRARSLKAPVIDATKAIMAIHQNHDYSHQGGKAAVWGGPERKRNIELMGGTRHSFSLEYATHLLTYQGVKAALTPRHLYFRMRAIPALHSRLHFLLTPFQVMEKALRTLRTIKPA